MNSKLYYHSNQIDNVVYDVLNPYKYQKVLDNNIFYLLMTLKEKKINIFIYLVCQNLAGYN